MAEPVIYLDWISNQSPPVERLESTVVVSQEGGSVRRS